VREVMAFTLGTSETLGSVRYVLVALPLPSSFPLSCPFSWVFNYDGSKNRIRTIMTKTNKEATMIKFYSAWFCPYAQRAWLALEHHEIPFEYIESLLVNKNQLEGHHGYDKNPRLLELNPKGLVPTLEFPLDIMESCSVEQKDKLKIVKDVAVLMESIDCIEFLNSMANKGADNKQEDLIPDPSFLSNANILNQHICSAFYKVLMKPNREEQKEAFVLFAGSLSDFISQVQEGGYYKSTSPTIVDFTVIPWILRLPLLKHYRPMFQLEECMSDDSFEKLTAYVERIRELPAVKKTLWKDENAFIEVYRRYADGTAQSQVGQAVRSGKNVHDV